MNIPILLRVCSLSLLLGIMSCSKDKKYECQEEYCDNGTCDGNECVCKSGFSGRNCDIENAPTGMDITNFFIIAFPDKNLSGESWDPNDDADLTMVFKKGRDTIWFAEYFYENVDTIHTYRFKVTPPIQITHPEDIYTITLLDYDPGEGFEGMTGMSFPMYLNGLKFPTGYALYHQSATVGFEVNYYW